MEAQKKSKSTFANAFYNNNSQNVCKVDKNIAVLNRPPWFTTFQFVVQAI